MANAESPVAGRGAMQASVLFAPPITAAALHWLLDSLAEKESVSLQALVAAAPPTGGPTSLMLQASLPFLGVALGLALLSLMARWVWRRFGPAWAIRAGVVLWILLWSGVALALGYRHLDRSQRQPLPELAATVLQASAQAPSTRGVGGARVLVRVPGFDVPQRTLLESADAASLPVGASVALAVERGRFGGIYVTGWSVGAEPGQPASS